MVQLAEWQVSVYHSQSHHFLLPEMQQKGRLERKEEEVNT